MRKVIYPGTFDPVTYGHIDVIKRAIDLFDFVAVTVAINPTKKPLFTIEERLSMLKESLKEYDNVSVESFDGLVVDYAHKVGAIGIRIPDGFNEQETCKRCLNNFFNAA